MNVENRVPPLAGRIGTAGKAQPHSGGSNGAGTRAGLGYSYDGGSNGTGTREALENGHASHAGRLSRERAQALAPPDPFTASVRLEASRAIVKCRGELDLASIATFSECLVGIAFVVHDLVLDFAELDFIDACGLRTIASTIQQVRAYGGSVSIRSPSRPIERLLDLVNFADIVAGDPHPFT